MREKDGWREGGRESMGKAKAGGHEIKEEEEAGEERMRASTRTEEE